MKKYLKYINWGGRFVNDPYHQKVGDLSKIEAQKRPLRSEVINHLLSTFNKKTNYLEIGVRDPRKNFDLIKSDKKYSVDPGLEFKENPVDFKLTSDEFFDQLANETILQPEIKFDVIFIDGLHLAEQVDKDIENALNYISDDGFVILHDCNPPSEWHARETHGYRISPAMNNWNGTTWKAFVKWRGKSELYSCCIDTDWGVGILSKRALGETVLPPENPFYEYSIFNETRQKSLNLISFEKFKNSL